MKNPDQPQVIESDVLRYKDNKIVRTLYGKCLKDDYSMNQIVMGVQNGEFSFEDYKQFTQLLGGSLSWLEGHLEGIKEALDEQAAQDKKFGNDKNEVSE